MLEFIFLRRNWEKDKKTVQRTLATYKVQLTASFAERSHPRRT